MTKARKVRFLLFLSFFGLTGLHLITQFGTGRGIYITFLIWSFFILCLPSTGKPIITSAVLYFFTEKSYQYASLLRWLVAFIFNIFTYLALPYIYLTSATTFLLYRIISNPWPYWLIIFVSSLGGAYNALVIKSQSHATRFGHVTIKTIFAIIGLFTFLYLSYFEIIIFLFSSTSR